MDNLTSVLADYASSLTFDELPAAVVHAAAQRVVDTVGCAIGGVETKPARIGRRLARGAAAERWPGRVLLSTDRSTAEAAGFANTAMIRNLDFNDSHPGAHPSDCLGALLGLAEAAGADGHRFLTAMVVAYELVTRISDAARLRERGWDQGYAIGVATTAGVGSLFRLPPDVLGQAIAITATANVPLRASRAGQLSLWKGAATAYAVRNGIFGAMLAAEGMTAPERPFEGRHGLWEQITGPFELAPFGGRGGEFRTPGVRLKYWPVEYNAQAGVWAAREVRTRGPIEEIEEIAIGTCWSGWHEIGSEPEKWDPRTRETADHSLPYIFARTLVDGEIGLAAFEPRAYLDPALRPLMQKIRVAVDEAIEARWPAEVVMRVMVRTTSGASHEIEIANPLGHERNPLGDDDISAKFRSLAQPRYGQRVTDELLARWWRVAELPSLTKALDRLALPPAGTPV